LADATNGCPEDRPEVRSGALIDVALGLLAITVLVILNGLYVAGEFALVAVDRTKIEALSEGGDRKAAGVLAGLRTLSFQLSGAQLGITITSLLVGFILEPTVGEALRPALEAIGLPERTALGVSVALALVLATAAQMIFGELLPKNLAIARPTSVAYWITPFLRFSNAMFKPLILFLNAAANASVRLFGIEPQEELSSARSLEELEVLIQSSRAGGALQESAYSLLTRSISFGEKTAGDALVPRTSMVTLRAEETLVELTEKSLRSGHSRFPIIGDDVDDIIGVVHVKDAIRVSPQNRQSTKVTQIMQDSLVVPESRDLKSLLVEMRRSRRQIAIVVDEYGGVAGLVTIEDIVEEIVGDIEDEHDPTYVSPEPEARRSGMNVVDGILRPDELHEATGLELPEGDFDTFAGFLLTIFDRIPRRGDHCGYDGWEFKVTDMDRNRITKVLVVAPPGQRGENAQ
jgi:CBS domain containing-hemolysin-like protein